MPAGPVAVADWLYWTLRDIQFWARLITVARLIGSPVPAWAGAAAYAVMDGSWGSPSEGWNGLAGR